MSASLIERIGKKALLSKVCSADEAAQLFKNGMTVAFSGFTPSGYPKVVPIAVAKMVEDMKMTNGEFKMDLFVGASTGAEIEDRWARNNMIRKRFPYQTGFDINKKINSNQVDFADIHLSMFPMNLKYGFYTKENGLNIALIEATEILPDGGIILGAANGLTPEACSIADKIIIELNTALPSYKGLHDIVCCQLPPHKKPYLISRVDDRIGSEALYVDNDKIAAIVESRESDKGRGLSEPDQKSKQIAENILNFFEVETTAGRLPPNLLPIQSGVGNIANAVVAGLAHGKFDNLVAWTEVLQDSFLDFFQSGKLQFCSAASLSLSTKGFEEFYKNFDFYKSKIMIRPQQISNSPEIIRRLGCISMNTPVEVDIYGHANSTHIAGSRVINGLGGSGDFERNGYLSIMHTPSTRKTKTDPHGISCIVPMCTHIDHTEHDLDIIVTEQGLADLRGLSPVKRAKEIIKQCVHPQYKDQLSSYIDFAIKKAPKASHEPQVLSKVFKMYESFQEKGTMKIDSW